MREEKYKWLGIGGPKSKAKYRKRGRGREIREDLGNETLDFS